MSARWIWPAAVLAGGIGLGWIIRNAGPALETTTPEPQSLVVSVAVAQAKTVQLSVDTQGTVEALYEIDLVPEVTGKVIAASPNFATGGFFSAGDELVRIDPADYELAVARAEAKVAEAVEALEVEHSKVDLANRGFIPSTEARIRTAEAHVKSANAELKEAHLKLERSVVRAPFDGRVMFTNIDPGQYVTAGQLLGRLYSTDIAEIRLPLTDRQLQFLDLPFGKAPRDQHMNTPVVIRARLGSDYSEWAGYLHRMEGAVDPDTRVWYTVARVDDPYGLRSAGSSSSTDTPPLAVGLFVEATISGSVVENVIELPRNALRRNDTVLVIDADDRLRQRQVNVLRTGVDTILISAGIQPGERVCVSPVEAVIDGLPVTVVETEQRYAGDAGTATE